jgi:hypothetical protein
VWRTLSLRQRAGVALAVWAIAFSLLAVASALPTGPRAVLTVDDPSPVVGQIVRFDASESLPHDQGRGRIVGYRFTFGDGQGTPEQSSPMATHAYSEEGEARATLTVRDARGLEGTASLAVHVQRAPEPTRPEPDLVPVAAVTIPARPEEREIVTVSVTILNHGGTEAEAATIDLFDDRPSGETVHIGQVDLPEPLPPAKAVVVFSESFEAVGVGDHTIRIRIGNVTPDEASTEDNELALTMTVRAATSPPPPDGDGFDLGTAALVTGFAVAAVAALTGSALLLLRPARPRPLEPPPAEPPDDSPPPLWPP